MKFTYSQWIRHCAKSYVQEFGAGRLDKEWSSTAYESLSTKDQGKHDWREFHDAIQAEINKRTK